MKDTKLLKEIGQKKFFFQMEGERAIIRTGFVFGVLYRYGDLSTQFLIDAQSHTPDEMEQTDSNLIHIDPELCSNSLEDLVKNKDAMHLYGRDM